MYRDEEIVSFYEAAFGPLDNPDPDWLAGVVLWCRKVIVADSLQEATRLMLAWASDGDVSAARESATRLRSLVHPSAAAPSEPELPSGEVLRRWLQATTRPGWTWWSAHHLPVYIEEGAAWRLVYADGELVRAWSAAGRRICPNFLDAAVRGWGQGCLGADFQMVEPTPGA